MPENIYVGGFSFALGLCDFKIDFRTVEPVLDPSGMMLSVADELAQRVTLPLPLAKEFSLKFQEAISSYEEKFGTIVATSELEKIANKDK